MLLDFLLFMQTTVAQEGTFRHANFEPALGWQSFWHIVGPQSIYIQ